MSKPRILIPITIQFSVRYLLRTGLLAGLVGDAEPVVLLGWKDPALRAEIEQLGIEVHDLPDTHYGPSYIRVRRQIDTWHFERLASPTTAIARRREDIDAPRRLRVIKQLRELRNSAYLRLPGYVRWLHAREQSLLASDTNFREFQQLIRSLRVDAMLSLTPFHRQEELVVRVAAAERLRTCAAILSFDNITVRGWIGALFDSYLLWNRHNAEQLRRGYPEARSRRVEIVGAPQFDFYWKPEFCWDEAAWRERMGLPTQRPVILYGGGPPSIVQHEPHIVMQLDAAIERREIPDHPVILLRRHPADTSERWAGVLRDAKHVVFDEPWPSGEVPKYSNIRDVDIAKLTSALKHSAVHVNVASTMTVDGAVFDRPQVGPAYDDRPGRPYDRTMRELYAHEHFLPITRSGGLDIVHDRPALMRAVTMGLSQPALRAAGRKKLVREIITFTDGHSTERVLAELRRVLGQH
jgi:hypothetical protein